MLQRDASIPPVLLQSHAVSFYTLLQRVDKDRFSFLSIRQLQRQHKKTARAECLDDTKFHLSDSCCSFRFLFFKSSILKFEIK